MYHVQSNASKTCQNSKIMYTKILQRWTQRNAIHLGKQLHLTPCIYKANQSMHKLLYIHTMYKEPVKENSMDYTRTN